MTATADVVAARRGGEFLSDLLGQTVRPSGETVVRCWNPDRHKNGDKNPSARANADKGVVYCHVCGEGVDVVQLWALRRGLAVDEAAREVRDHLGQDPSGPTHPSRNGGVQSRPGLPTRNHFPFWPEEAERAGWELGNYHGRACLRLPIYDEKLEQLCVKVRMASAPGQQKAALESIYPGAPKGAGLCGDVESLLDLQEGAELWVVAGETDYLALKAAARGGEAAATAVFYSNGEKPHLGGHEKKMRGLRVLVLYDLDEPGRKAARGLVEALRQHGADAVDVVLPIPKERQDEGLNDLRDWLSGCGGSWERLRELVKPEPAAEEEPRSFAWTGGQALLSKSIPPLRWLVGDGLLYRGGITQLSASHKRGKSLLGLQLALSLVRRNAYPADDEHEWLGSPVLGAGPVCYLSGEGGELMIQHRLRILEPLLGEPLDDLHVLAMSPLPDLSTERDRDAVFDYARSVGAVAVVVDPLSRFCRMQDENDPALVTDLYGRVRDAGRAADVGTLLIHHDPKPSADRGQTVQAGRGSSVMANEVDALINLRPADAEDDKLSSVYFAGRWGTPDPCQVRIEENLKVRFVCRLGAQKTRSRRTPEFGATRFAEALRDAGAGVWFSRDEWAEAAGCSSRTLKRRISDGLLDDLAEIVEAEDLGGRRGWRYRFVATGGSAA